MRLPHPFPYQGSKRNIARNILAFFPDEISRLIEPFAGSAAVSIAAASFGKAGKFVLNDINVPLMELWEMIVFEPEELASRYKRIWKEQAGREREYYDKVRESFNHDPRPDYLLYLLARCVKASIRYNAFGAFNQSPDNRRKGMRPDKMAENIFLVSKLFKGKVKFSSQDYKKVLAAAAESDLVYMDPPYQGVCGNRDPRYLNNLSFHEYVKELEHLNEQGISYIVSYDGRTGDKRHGLSLPKKLNLSHLEISAGRSSQATLLGRKDETVESLYLSPALRDRLGCVDPRSVLIQPEQYPLFQGA
jgi:DNA adenine methylase